ncbi:MAG: hypothetical protein K2V38_12435, partial [Gemmataceae bacterium]|nr:hypothetical protein [Gemmataceae bacterium]
MNAGEHRHPGTVRAERKVKRLKIVARGDLRQRPPRGGIPDADRVRHGLPPHARIAFDDDTRDAGTITIELRESNKLP